MAIFDIKIREKFGGKSVIQGRVERKYSFCLKLGINLEGQLPLMFSVPTALLPNSVVVSPSIV